MSRHRQVVNGVCATDVIIHSRYVNDADIDLLIGCTISIDVCAYVHFSVDQYRPSGHSFDKKLQMTDDRCRSLSISLSKDEKRTVCSLDVGMAIGLHCYSLRHLRNVTL